MARKRFGTYFKQLRIESRQTLRNFCLKHGFDPGNISKLERGRLPPPQAHEKLAKYAKALGLKAGTDQWYEFFDRAAAEHGRIPKDILSQSEVVEKLPVLFRTLRGQKVRRSDLLALVEKIRRT